MAIPKTLAERLDPDLAMELASGLRPAGEVAVRFGLEESELKELLTYPPFRAMVKEAKSRWGSDMNAEQRVRAKAALAVEDTIPDLHGIVVDEDVKPNYRSDAFMKLARVAQLDAPPAPGATGQTFSLTINVPGAAPVTAIAPHHGQTLVGEFVDETAAVPESMWGEME